MVFDCFFREHYKSKIMKRIIISLIMSGGLLLFLSACNNPPSTADHPDTTANAKNEENAKMMSPGVPGADDKLRTAMHTLWDDHVVWTRNVILCLVDDVPGGDQAVQRLLENQDDIGNAIKPYYGEDAGTKLSTLLREHIMIAADVVKAAKMDNKAALDKANKSWYANADTIATFLSNANSAWLKEDMKMMMHDHLQLTTNEAVARIKKDYDTDIKTFDKVDVQIAKMADMLTDGIIKQFPEKFETTTSVSSNYQK